MTPPSIAILTTGNELLNGDRTDTNTGTIARRLNECGFQVDMSVSVADSPDRIEAALRQLAQQVRIIITTGGLGSTGDDLTARAAARFSGQPLAVNEEALTMIRQFATRSGRTLESLTERQALLPQKAVPLPNSVGTAPGFWLQHQQCDLFFLPGVPAEMTAMFDTAVLPTLQRTFTAGAAVQRRKYRLFGLSEPKVESLIPYQKLPEGVDVAFALDYPQVIIKLACSKADADILLNSAEKLLYAALGEFIVGQNDDTMAGQVGHLLTRQKKTLSLAESCTGGLIAQLLTRQAGASTFLERGAVTYADSAKIDWLKIDPDLLHRHGAVSEQCAREMVRGIRRAADTDLAVAVTGIAGPDGGTTDKPVGTVYLALATDDIEQVQRYRFSGSREQVQIMTAHMALEWLRRYLLGSC
ncbi:MAG: damage-inducible protein CinA [Desulfuromonas sp.]|nr:MAG: damage-inducible protein CinA [Desulfuromonas sp.]